jgi:minor extracellular protease Epr
VKVGVVDTGVGKHPALPVSGSRNTTEESPRRIGDWHGHGTHVAGVIASTAARWRRGEASGVTLHSYRIFEDGDDEASTFAISAAIKQAALDGCDLVNSASAAARLTARARRTPALCGCACAQPSATPRRMQ